MPFVKIKQTGKTYEVAWNRRVVKNRDISIEFLIYKCEALRYLRTSFPLPLLVWITQVLRALSSSQGHSSCCWSWVCRGACEGAWYARQFPAQVKTRQEKNISSVAFLRAEITSTVSVLLPPTPLFSLGRETEKKAAKLPCLCNQFLFNGICCNSKVHHLKVLLYYYFFLYVDLNILLYLLRETDCLRPHKPFPLSWHSPVPHSWCEFYYYHLQFKKIKPILEGKKGFSTKPSSPPCPLKRYK